METIIISMLLITGGFGISAVLEVYVEHNGIYPDYALEKLENSKSYIDAAIRYYLAKKDKGDEE